jgi:hypothetical protein
MSKLPTRAITPFILQDLKTKMVFLGGPRQVGKTTLSQSLIKKYYDKHPAYLNWDSDQHRQKIRNQQWPRNEKLIVFDEIHKYKGWRNLIKGFFDTLKNTHSFLVTGSARLDHFRRGGDSLAGRYHYYRLHPYSLPELGNNPQNLQTLLEFGGFPEPLIHRNKRHLRRWHKDRIIRLVREDLRDLTNIIDIDKVELLAQALVERVGSPLSMKSLAEDLEVDPKTIKKWIETLDSLYYCFQIAPYGSPKIRAVKKEQKLYLWDWSQIEEPGFRFENMVASQLLKYCHHMEDVDGHHMELRYIRDTDKREVDFVVLQNKKPLFAVECKLKEKNLSSHIKYFKERTNIPQFYQVHTDEIERVISDEITITSFAKFCVYEKMI